MDKKVKIFIICVLLIIVIFVAIKVFVKKDVEEVVVDSNDVGENKVENIVNEIEESEEIDANTMIEENHEDYSTAINEIPMEQQLQTTKQEDNIYETSSDIGSTDKKQEAINLVKQTWGEDDTVTFSCDSVNASGKYIIAVASKTEARVLCYYKVDLTTKTVEVDY